MSKKCDNIAIKYKWKSGSIKSPDNYGLSLSSGQSMTKKGGTENSNQNHSLSLYLTILEIVILSSLWAKQLWDVVCLPVSLLNNAENKIIIIIIQLLAPGNTCSWKIRLWTNSLLIKIDTLLSRITSRPSLHCAYQSKSMMSQSLP